MTRARTPGMLPWPLRVLAAALRAVRRPIPCECPVHAMVLGMMRTRAAPGWGPPVGSPTLPVRYVAGPHTWDLLGRRYVCPGSPPIPPP